MRTELVLLTIIVEVRETKVKYKKYITVDVL